MPIPPNKIKFSGSSDNKSIKANGFSLGVSSVSDYGPTSSTGYWNTIAPPENGYTIYLNKASQGPSMYVCANDATLVNMTNYVAGSAVANNATDAVFWFKGQSDKLLSNRDYEDIAVSGLVFMVDAGFVASYPRSGATWTDLSYSNKNATLVNTPTFSASSGGTLYFASASQEYATFADLGSLSNFTVEAWVCFKSVPTSNTYPAIVTNVFPGGQYVGYAMGVLNSPWDGKITGGFFNNGWKITSGFTPSTNTWYHIATTYDGTIVRLYRDGSLYSQNSVGSSAVSSGQGGYIARRWDDPDYIDGDIPIARIYNRALTDAEILRNYRSQSARTQSAGSTWTLTFTGGDCGSINCSTNSQTIPENVTLYFEVTVNGGGFNYIIYKNGIQIASYSTDPGNPTYALSATISFSANDTLSFNFASIYGEGTMTIKENNSSGRVISNFNIYVFD